MVKAEVLLCILSYHINYKIINTMVMLLINKPQIEVYILFLFLPTNIPAVKCKRQR